MKFRCIGFDPGIIHFAYSVIEFDEQTRRWEILATGLLLNPVDKMTNLPAQIPSFGREITMLLGHWRPEFVAIERFLNRGRMNAGLNEKINVQIGLIVAETMRIGATLGVPTSGDWKNDVNRIFVLNDCYIAARKIVRDALKGWKPPVEIIKQIWTKGKWRLPTRRKVTSLKRTSDLSKELQDTVPHTLDATIIAIRHVIRELKLTRTMRLIISGEMLCNRLAECLLRQAGKL